MISISPFPAAVNSGQTVCITVTGSPTIPIVSADIGAKSLVTRVTGGKGTYVICVTVPRGMRGLLEITIGAGSDYETVDIGVQ